MLISYRWLRSNVVVQCKHMYISPKRLAVVVLVVGFVIGLIIGDRTGYRRAESDIRKTQELAAQKAADDATKASNPFKGVNPVADVEANPFQEAKRVLNPFN